MSPRLSRYHYLAFGFALVAVRIIGFNHFHFYDDAYITLRYAKNLLAGSGFVFNPGEWILGITTPLWGLVGTVLHLLPVQIEYSVVTVSILADLGTLLITMRMLERQASGVAAWLFGLLFIGSGVLTRLGVGGMESSLFLFMTVLAIKQYQDGKRMLGVTLGSIAYFLRPEGVLVVLVMVLWPMFFERKWTQSFKLGVLSLAIVAPFLAILYHYYGTFMPQSVAAKATIEPWSLWMVIKGLVLSDPLCFVVLPLTLYGAVHAWRVGGYMRMWLVWIVPFALAYFIARPPVFRWYGEPAHYAEFLFSALAIAALLRNRELLQGKLLKPVAVTIILAMLIGGWGAVLATQREDRKDSNLYYQFRDYFTEHPVKGDTLLCGDIGAIGYYSDAHIIDPYGLVTPDALKYDSIPADVWHYKPKYFLAYEISWQIGHFIYNPWMLKEYTLIHHFDAQGKPMDSIVLDPEIYPPGISGFFLLKRNEPQ